MSLSYTTYVTTRKTQPGKPWIVLSETRERVTREVTAPDYWCCYTSSAEVALRKKAERLIAKVEKIMAGDDIFAKQAKIEAALVSFIASWKRMSGSKTYAGSGVSDTAVRECVGSFHDKIVAATYGRGYCDYDEWERHNEQAYRRIRKSRGY